MYAYKKRRILLTHDDDYLNNKKFPLTITKGVVILPGGAGSEKATVKGLGNMLRILAPFNEVWSESKVVFHEDDTMMVWQRNFKSGKIEKSRYSFKPNQPAMVWVDE